MIRCGRDRRNGRTLDSVSVAALTIVAELKAIGLTFSDIAPLITRESEAQADIRGLLQSHIQNLERQRAAAIAYMTSLPVA
ncbi:hypothetical protein BH10PSE3_BH10PSE3_32920 [soil metagenome]